MEKLRYPIGIQSFEKLRKGGYCYVDKTSYISKLIDDGGYYFLSRPRRFGKSLLLSTIAAYFRGQRDLFTGLEIEAKPHDWEPYPVLYLDLNNGAYNSLAELEEVLERHLSAWEEMYGIDSPSRLISLRFGEVIRKAYEVTGKGVVILVDEYDKPLLQILPDAPLADDFRNMLRGVYSNLKTMDYCISFGMVTGVAKFSKISIFSDINNLRDISFLPAFAGICGITEEELRQNFGQGVTELAHAMEIPEDEAYRQLKTQYDGYRFSIPAPCIYNPWSLLNCLADKHFFNYWFSTGTPSYIVRRIASGNLQLAELSGYVIDKDLLINAGIASLDPIPHLYQTGYLTLESYDSEFEQYHLNYPNEEVKAGFLKFLIPYYLLSSNNDGNSFNISKFITAIRQGEIEQFMELLASKIAGVPYTSDGSAPESHFQNAVYLIFELMGFHTHMELRTANGRIDILVETTCFIYIFEFKIDQSAQVALDQIKKKEYDHPYIHSGKKIYLIGANFDSTNRTMAEWIYEEIPPIPH